MSKTLILIPFIIIGFLLYQQFQAPGNQPKISQTTEPITIIAHRAGFAQWPENTIYGVRASIQQGVDAIELDLQTTKDGQFVVMHDNTLDRTTNGVGLVSDYTLAEITALDAGYTWKAADDSYPFRDQGITVPTIDEVLMYASRIPIILDIKSYSPNALLKLCGDSMGEDLRQQIWLGRFETNDVKLIRHWCDNQLKISVSYDELEQYDQTLDHLNLRPFTILQAGDKSEGFEDLFALALEHNVDIIVGWVKSPKEAQSYLERGAIGILSDVPVDVDRFRPPDR